MTTSALLFGLIGALGGAGGIAALVKIFLVDRKTATSTVNVSYVEASDKYVKMVEKEIEEARALRNRVIRLEAWVRLAYQRLTERDIDLGIGPPPVDRQEEDE